MRGKPSSGPDQYLVVVVLGCGVEWGFAGWRVVAGGGGWWRVVAGGSGWWRGW